jgi:hypothetical protein
MEEMRGYLDDAYLMDIYSFPEYRVKGEFIIICDDPPTPVTQGDAPRRWWTWWPGIA